MRHITVGRKRGSSDAFPLYYIVRARLDKVDLIPVRITRKVAQYLTMRIREGDE